MKYFIYHFTNITSICTKSVDSNFHVFWLAPITWNILGYSLVCERREKWHVVLRKFQIKKLCWVSVPGGGCHSLGCHGYLRALLDAPISLGTTTRFYRHLPQAHLLAMSLIAIYERHLLVNYPSSVILFLLQVSILSRFCNLPTCLPWARKTFMNSVWNSLIFQLQFQSMTLAQQQPQDLLQSKHQQLFQASIAHGLQV